MVKEILDNKCADEHFIRMFMLVLMGTVLAPTSHEEVPALYLSLLENTANIKNINWNEFTLRFLMDNINSLATGHGSDNVLLDHSTISG